MQEQINKFVKTDDEKEGKCNISNLVEEDFLKNMSKNQGGRGSS